MENSMISDILYLSLPDKITGTNLKMRLLKYISGVDHQTQSCKVNKDDFTWIFNREG